MKNYEVVDLVEIGDAGEVIRNSQSPSLLMKLVETTARHRTA